MCLHAVGKHTHTLLFSSLFPAARTVTCSRSRMPPPASSSPAFTACDPAVAPASRGRTGEKMDLTSPGVSLSLHKGKAGGVPAAAAGATASSSQSSGPTAGKLLVRNIPFEASRDEVEQVFSAFPGFKSVRLPKKLASSMGSGARNGAGSAAGSHRGFAFIEYDTRSGAEKALESLSASTHLYGRRLVLEWAKAADEDDAGPGESLYDKSRVIGSDAGQEGMMARRFKKSNLNSSLRSVSAAASGDVRVDPLDCNPLA